MNPKKDKWVDRGEKGHKVTRGERTKENEMDFCTRSEGFIFIFRKLVTTMWEFRYQKVRRGPESKTKSPRLQKGGRWVNELPEVVGILMGKDIWKSGSPNRVNSNGVQTDIVNFGVRFVKGVKTGERQKELGQNKVEKKFWLIDWRKRGK